MEYVDENVRLTTKGTPMKRFPYSDLTGRVFSAWTVIGLPERDAKWRMQSWWCRCECGTEGRVGRKNLENGGSTGCIKCRNKRRRAGGDGSPDELIGMKFGDLTVLSCDGVNRHQLFMYRCECKCGGMMSLTGSSLRTGRTIQCPKCRPERLASSVLRAIWCKVRWGASARNLELSIAFDQAMQLLETQQFRCALSGLPLSISKTMNEYQHGGTTASLDRIDSSVGYVAGNVQWVHKTINQMKMDLPETDFVALCRLIVSHHSDKGVNYEH